MQVTVMEVGETATCCPPRLPCDRLSLIESGIKQGAHAHLVQAMHVLSVKKAGRLHFVGGVDEALPLRPILALVVNGPVWPHPGHSLALWFAAIKDRW